MNNWKTTVFGGVPAIGVIADGIAAKNWFQVLGGIGLLLASWFAKDYSVTGTTTK